MRAFRGIAVGLALSFAFWVVMFACAAWGLGWRP